MIALLAVLLTIAFSSPDDKSSTIAQWSNELPADFATTAAMELAGTSDTAEYGPPYNHSSGSVQHFLFLHPQRWLGVSHPINTAEDYVVKPLETVPNDPALQSALAEYKAAPEKQKKEWAAAYAKPLEEYAAAKEENKTPPSTVSVDESTGTVTVKTTGAGPVPVMMASLASLAKERRAGRRPGEQQTVLPDRLHQAAAVHGGRRTAGRTRRSQPPARRAVGADERDRELPGPAVAVAVCALVPGRTDEVTRRTRTSRSC